MEIEQETRREKGWGNLKKKFPGEWREEPTRLKYWRDRVYVPKGVTQERILKEHYDTTLVGHPGQHRMHENIFWQFWWPTLQKDIRQYIEGCSLCQHSTPSSSYYVTTIRNSYPQLATNLCRHDRSFTKIRRIWCDTSHCWLSYQDGTFPPNYDNCDQHECHTDLYRQCVQTIWNVQKHD